jgi:hypothetical protein
MAWDGQMYDGAVDPNQPNDLYEPVAGHQSAHGTFDARARTSSWEAEVTMRASWLATSLSHVAGQAVRLLTHQDAVFPTPHVDGRQRVPVHR